jgi:DNA ligase-4
VVPAPSCGILLAPSEVICGRVVPLLPDECLPGLGPDPYSKVSSSLADLQDMYNRAVARQEEGVVVKALNSSWVINDRSGAWLKVKPDYLENVEVDCLVIGGYYGTGRNGGQISEYLLALAEEPAVPTAAPSRWVSFTRCGQGCCGVEVVGRVVAHLHSTACMAA